MLWLKSCPRCTTGDVTLSQDVYGSFVFCLHCGYSKDLEPKPRSHRNGHRMDSAERRLAQPA
jgi:hypothetical protein